MATLIRVEPTEAESAATIPGRTSAGVPGSVPASPEPLLGLAPMVSPVVNPVISIERKVRRLVSPISGLALEKLGHAIEYLTDEYAFEAAVSGSQVCGEPALQAIQLLMSLNRQVYFECPIVEPLAQRIFSRLFPAHPEPSRR